MRLERARDLDAAGDERHVLAVAQDLALADLEAVVGREQARRGAAARAHIDGAVEVENGARGEGHLHGIGGRDDRHARNGAEGRDVFQALRRAAVGPGIEPGMARDDLHIAPCIGDRKPRLLERAQAEHREGGDDGQEARRPPCRPPPPSCSARRCRTGRSARDASRGSDACPCRRRCRRRARRGGGSCRPIRASALPKASRSESPLVPMRFGCGACAAALARGVIDKGLELVFLARRDRRARARNRCA